MIFGGDYDKLNNFSSLKIRDDDIEFVDVWKYLGFYLKNGNYCSFCHKNELASFYRSSNSIIRSLKKPNEAVQLHLLYSNCVSILTYGSEVKEYHARDFSTCNTAVNSAIRCIFSFKYWQSTRFIREQLGYASLTELFARARSRFSNSISQSSNPILKHLNETLSAVS